MKNIPIHFFEYFKRRPATGICMVLYVAIWSLFIRGNFLHRFEKEGCDFTPILKVPLVAGAFATFVALVAIYADKDKQTMKDYLIALIIVVLMPFLSAILW